MKHKVISQFLGGSHAYGLNTPDSDEDVRGVFVHTDPRYIVGLGRYEHQEDIANGNDIKHKEFRAFVNLLRKGNSEAIEMLYHDRKEFDVLEPEFKLLRDHRDSLVDPHRLFKVLLGYMQGEKRLANGERTGKLGGKRKAQIDKYGFSPKNFVQLFRLAQCGMWFFDQNHFFVNVMAYDKGFGEWLLDIKTHPENHRKDELNKAVEAAEKNLKLAYDDNIKKFTTKFDEDLANELVVKTYLKVLNDNV